MENNFNFKSQMCTTVAQSERLLALGLKKDTADMGSVRNLVHTTSNGTREVIFTFTPDNWEANPDSIPRWSLHRLIEMMPEDVSYDNVSEYFTIGKDFFVGQYVTYGQLFWKEGTSIYDNIIDCIEWLIKEGYFNKEYLEE